MHILWGGGGGLLGGGGDSYLPLMGGFVLVYVFLILYHFL